MKLILPYRGEFGHVCMWHAPQVHAIEAPKVVVCEPSLRAMYPSADEFVDAASIPDRDRRGRGRGHTADELARYARMAPDADELVYPSQTAPRRYFRPQPIERQLNIFPDVVICPRWREHDACRNWHEWPTIAAGLEERYLSVFAAGKEDASLAIGGVDAAWHYADPLSATIEAMRSVRLVIATDSGLAHLAVLCGTPLLLVVHDQDRISPGVSSDGIPMWSVSHERYNAENHTGSPIVLATHGWFTPERVLGMAEGMLGI